MTVSRALSTKLLAGAFVAAAFTMSSPTEVSAANGRVTLSVGGVKRTATLVEYERLKKRRRPVIILLNSGTRASGAGLRARRNLGLDAYARKTGAIVVYPDALPGGWGIGAAGQKASGDAAFVRQLAERLIAQGTASKRRIYLAGISAGGMLAMKIGCENADLFAGIGVFIANMPADWAASCKPSRPLAFMVMNGTADPLIPYNGGAAEMAGGKRDLLSTEATAALFAQAAQCSAKRGQAMTDRNRKDASTVSITHWTGCKAPVSLVKVEGGGHTIPGRRAGLPRATRVGAQNQDIDGARVMWDFLLHRSAS